MMFSAKPILISLLLAFSVMVAPAQPGSTSLPSLFNDDASKKTQSDDTDMLQTLKQKMFVKVFANSYKIFIGEPIMVTYKFYVAMNLHNRPSVTKQPEFSGWSVKELQFDQGPEFENINNEPYSVYTIRKVQLTPLQEGSLSLGRANVNNEVEIFNAESPYVPQKFSINVSNTDMAVEVNNLPEKNKPENFYGITGVFNIKAAASKNKIPAGENGHLIITIKGAGNLEAIVEPEVTWPHNTEHFDGKDSQHVNQDNFPVSGDRVFDIPFIGKNEGSATIPPVKFSFFNTALKDYQTVTTDSIPVTFTSAISDRNEIAEVVDYDISNRKYLWIVPAIAVTVALVGFISYRRNKAHALKAKPVTVTPAPVFTQVQTTYQLKYRTDFSRYLTELKTIREHKPFFTKAKMLLTRAVAERLDSNQNSEHVLLEELKQRTYNAPVCNKVDALYEAINLHLYAPFETEADLEFYFSEVKQVIAELQVES